MQSVSEDRCISSTKPHMQSDSCWAPDACACLCWRPAGSASHLQARRGCFEALLVDHKVCRKHAASSLLGSWCVRVPTLVSCRCKWQSQEILKCAVKAANVTDEI